MFFNVLVLLFSLHAALGNATVFDIPNRTKEPDRNIVILTRAVKSHIEQWEATKYSVFEPVSFYEYYDPDHDSMLYWIKVKNDGGFMHVKIKVYLLINPLQPLLIDYHREIAEDQNLPPFVEEILKDNFL